MGGGKGKGREGKGRVGRGKGSVLRGTISPERRLCGSVWGKRRRCDL
jgi:hypothetical protein